MPILEIQLDNWYRQMNCSNSRGPSFFKLLILIDGRVLTKFRNQVKILIGQRHPEICPNEFRFVRPKAEKRRESQCRHKFRLG